MRVPLRTAVPRLPAPPKDSERGGGGGVLEGEAGLDELAVADQDLREELLVLHPRAEVQLQGDAPRIPARGQLVEEVAEGQDAVLVVHREVGVPALAGVVRQMDEIGRASCRERV